MPAIADPCQMDRRRLLACACAALLSPGHAQNAQPRTPIRRPLPRNGGTLPVIGLGTWLTFDVRDDLQELAQRREVLSRFFAAGGGMIDSSPMYGQAQWLLGELLPVVPHEGKLFSATKVWTPFDRSGPGQLEESLKLWRLQRFDVLLVHN